MQYAAIYSKTRTGFSAHVPDLPGCVAAGKMLDETRKLMREAIALHIRGMREDGLPIQAPSVIAEQVQVDAA